MILPNDTSLSPPDDDKKKKKKWDGDDEEDEETVPERDRKRNLGSLLCRFAAFVAWAVRKPEPARLGCCSFFLRGRAAGSWILVPGSWFVVLVKIMVGPVVRYWWRPSEVMCCVRTKTMYVIDGHDV